MRKLLIVVCNSELTINQSEFIIKKEEGIISKKEEEERLLIIYIFNFFYIL